MEIVLSQGREVLNRTQSFDGENAYSRNSSAALSDAPLQRFTPHSSATALEVGIVVVPLTV